MLPPGYSRVLSTNFCPFGPAVLPALSNILTYCWTKKSQKKYY